MYNVIYSTVCESVVLFQIQYGLYASCVRISFLAEGGREIAPAPILFELQYIFSTTYNSSQQYCCRTAVLQ